MEQRIIRNKPARVNIVYDCVECGKGPTEIIDSRPGRKMKNGKVSVLRRRRRRCTECGCRFTTWEIPVGGYDIVKQELKRVRGHVRQLVMALDEAREGIGDVNDQLEKNEINPQ